MSYKLFFLLRRAKHILQTEGLVPLIRRGFVFLAHYFFRYGTYCLYEQVVKERSEAGFASKVPNATFKIVSTNQQADELMVEGLDLRLHFINARQWLDKGVIAFCVFVGGEIAHISWVVMDAEAKRKTNQLPCQVDFSNNEAYLAFIETNPRYRRMGLWGYNHHKILQFLREKGIVTLRSVVAKNNIASQRGHAKHGARLYAEARYLRILWWKLWKERPLISQ